MTSEQQAQLQNIQQEMTANEVAYDQAGEAFMAAQAVWVPIQAAWLSSSNPTVMDTATAAARQTYIAAATAFQVAAANHMATLMNLLAQEQAILNS